ncbi:MAG: hypothetical protein NMNS01_27160 [Nitrosomonas sp.]|nr:MAG: hypothetical protein NMNS01_27160 [Nitrosomonas sp.]
MTVKRSISYTAFNIRTHPHSTENYISLINRVFELKYQVNLRGDTYAIMTQIANITDNPEDGVFGEIGKYTKIKDSSKWLNLDKLRAAEEHETKKINIPHELRPNFINFNFVFYPKNHFLIIECKDTTGSISPKTLEIYFRTVFSLDEINNEFKTIEFTLVPQTDFIDSIFEIKTLKTLELTIRRPNTDGLDDLEDEVFERLNKQNIGQEFIQLRAQKGSSIEPDRKTRSLANVALLNGEVKATGNDAEGKRVIKSTKQHPLIEIGHYTPGNTTARDFLLVMADRIISKIKSITKLNNDLNA